MNGTLVIPMGLLTLKKTDYNGGRPRIFGSLMFCADEKRHGIFLGYAPRDLKRGDTVCISLDNYEKLLKKVDDTYQVNIRISRKCTLINWLRRKLGIRNS